MSGISRRQAFHARTIWKKRKMDDSLPTTGTQRRPSPPAHNLAGRTIRKTLLEVFKPIDIWTSGVYGRDAKLARVLRQRGGGKKRNKIKKSKHFIPRPANMSNIIAGSSQHSILPKLPGGFAKNSWYFNFSLVKSTYFFQQSSESWEK